MLRFNFGGTLMFIELFAIYISLSDAAIILKSSATTVTIIGVVQSYSTNFAVTENPIYENGKWVNGGSKTSNEPNNGLDWHNVKTVSGIAIASVNADSEGQRYADDIAVLTTNFTFGSQYAQGTVYRASGYLPTSGHEIELLLDFKITPRCAQGWEIMWGHTGYISIVHWNGPLGDYTVLVEGSNNMPGTKVPADGDTLRAEVKNGTINVYINNSTKAVATVAKGNFFVRGACSSNTSGQPGIGFWPVESASPDKFGWKSFQAGSL